MMISKKLCNYRLRKAVSGTNRSEVDALLLTGRSNIEYLTGFHIEQALLLLPSGAKPVYFVDRMNEHLAFRELSGKDVDISVGDSSQTVPEYFRKARFKKVGIYRDEMTVAMYFLLFKKGGTLPVAAPGILEGLRCVKDESEIKALRAAGRETIKAWRFLKSELVYGMTEKEVCYKVESYLRARKCSLAFPTIAAFGPDSQHPHAVPTNRSLKPGEHVLVDMGAKKCGYCSDLTRVWAKGRMNRKIRELEKEVNRVHDDAISSLRPGRRVGALAEKAYKGLVSSGFGEYVRHSLGHGVGLQIHEVPFLRISSGMRLKKGMVLTIEPGLYVPGLGGVRKEDTVLITSRGCEVLTS